MIGQTLSHYRILEKLGEGGMGVLYRALDTHLERSVALKLLPPEAVGDPDRKRRFVQEARAASALNHPNIVTIHDIDRAGGHDFIAMECVDGRPLDAVLAGPRLTVGDALDYAVQIADALAAAHAAGILHRDVKPSNVMVTPAGRVKVLDFGLAKLTERSPAGDEDPTRTPGPRTDQGVILGTAAYMSPEQAEGKAVDARTDVFSLGAVLYEMLTGRRPFQGDSKVSTLMAILRERPAPMKAHRPDVPADLERVALRCLEKDRDARYPSARELMAELAACRSRLSARDVGWSEVLRRPRLAVPAVLLVLAAAAVGAWLWVRGSRERWARTMALPEIARLTQEDRIVDAFLLAREAGPHLREDPQFQRLWRQVSTPVSIRTTPPGAQVLVREYGAADADWQLVGTTPLEIVAVPATSYLRWKVAKPGYETVEAAVFTESRPNWEFSLSAAGAAPSGMVPVPGRSYELGSLPPVELQEYWLDRFEVTNREFKEFVDRGGYRTPRLWQHAFVKNGRKLSWDEAMGEFRDATGRPGPATWELGTYPGGQADHPVSGVSWYEAAAYSEFVGKTLPTIYHWHNAAAGFGSPDILRLSNFGGQGPARVGSHQGLGRYGTYDMAGNVKEWCWNEVGGRRYILGGAWREPSYMFTTDDAQAPFDRSPTHGFRCAKHAGPLPVALTAPIQRIARDYSQEKPVGDDVFAFYRSVYSYDRSDLKAVVESVDDTPEHWRKETITFDAAYGGERVTAHLFLPKSASPPYQTVVHFPGAYSLRLRSSQHAEEFWFVEFVMRSGRALLYPVYKGTFERRVEGAALTPALRRDLLIQWSKDLGRSLDYLETRNDIERERLAYYGFSLGAANGPILTALDSRFKASVLLFGGFYLRRDPPEAEAIHFAPRARMPVLMLNGRHDFTFPLEQTQLPMFRLLGAPERDKRHVLFDSGHMPPRNQEVVKEVLDWLDRYLGPVGAP